MMHLILLFVTVSFLGANQDARAHDKIVVMTQNQYLGGDLPGVIGADTPEEFNQAVVAVLRQIAENNFPERADALAEEIARWQPHLVGLQEVYDFKCNGQNGDPPFRDHLADTLDALEVLGVPYKAVASVRNLDVTVPIAIPGSSCSTITVTDRDVILAREEVGAMPVDFSSSLCGESQDGCNYQARVPVSTPFGSIELLRGFVGVDAKVEGKDYRFVNTHLEVRDIDPTNPLSPVIQAKQAEELIAILKVTTSANRSLIVLGDINSSPVDSSTIAGIDPPYHQFIEAGYFDTWTLRPGRVIGFTCCQLEDLSNHHSLLYERIDMIFTAEQPRKVKARVLGDRIADKTRPSRLWPSDHAAVVAELQFD